MATISEISQGAQYVGNAALGGGNDGVITIDTKPLENLALYTMMYNKSKWDQKQKDAETQAAQLAQMTAYDLSNSIPKYRDMVMKGYNEFYSWVKENPNVLDFRKNQKGYLEYKKKKQDFENLLLKAKAQDVLYKAGVVDAEASSSAAVKADKLKKLDEATNNSTIDDPIRIYQYNSVKAKLPESIPNIKVDKTKVDANGQLIIERTYTIPDQRNINNTAQALSTGMFKAKPDFEKITDPRDRKLAEDEYASRVASGDFAEEQEAKTITEALKSEHYNKYKDANGKLNVQAMIEANDLPIGLQSIIEHNKAMDAERKKIEAGDYSDEFGKPFAGKGLDVNDFRDIDFSDGEITTEDLFRVKLRAKAVGTSYDTETKPYDDGSLKRMQLAIDKFNSDTARINANKKPVTSADIPKVILNPIEAFKSHIQRLKSNKFIQQGSSIDFDAPDDQTKVAIGWTEDDKTVTYNPDGSFIITDKKGNKRTGTIEQLWQGFINAVKRSQGIQEGNVEQNASFQQASEQGLRIYSGGSPSALDYFNKIMNSKGSAQQAPSGTDSNGFPTN